ncbi:MAG: hypothetical protein JNM07_10785 [Phycisphaerae bacterium]|nr:hypothetical protein [Phycisphaerae bacterium]
MPRDAYVSHRKHGDPEPGHARLELADGRWLLRDLATTNMTWRVRNGDFAFLASGVCIATGKAFLFGCGESSFLFLDPAEPPAPELIDALCRDPGAAGQARHDRPSTAASDSGSDTETETLAAPMSEEAAACARWKHARNVLGAHGLTGP